MNDPNAIKGQEYNHVIINHNLLIIKGQFDSHKTLIMKETLKT